MISRLFKIINAQFAVLSAVALCLAPVSKSFAQPMEEEAPQEASMGIQEPSMGAPQEGSGCPCPAPAPCCADNGGYGNGYGNSSYADNKWLMLGGAALLGAVAGAAAGAAASNSGDRGPIGPEGPPGTFPADEGESLIFTFTMNVTATSVGSTVTAFVSAPDGTVTETAVIPIAVLGLAAIPPIVITDPVFGTYTTGVQVSSGGVAVVATLTETVTASRDATVTTLLNLLPAVGIINNLTQTSVDFTYGTLVP